MIVNKKIKEVFNEITTQSIKYANTPDKERKYLKRLLDIFKRTLTEDEQLFIFKTVLEQIHYRNIITDPDNVIQIYNVKLRTITYIFLLTIIIIFLIAILFKTNDGLNMIINLFSNVLKLLVL